MLYVVGIGPGHANKMTLEAYNVLKTSDTIIGYTGYVNLIKDIFPDKNYIATAMKEEIERCRKALELSSQGRTISVISSGDSGIYGMAGLILELAVEYPLTEIQIISGVTSASSGASLLGAPLNHDFAVISLSNLLTPWDVIADRIKYASMADFVICLYNPASRKRDWQMKAACDIMLQYKGPDTVCGWVRNIGRAGETKKILALKELKEEKIDMFTTVYIGNKSTGIKEGRMITPRGYRI